MYRISFIAVFFILWRGSDGAPRCAPRLAMGGSTTIQTAMETTVFGIRQRYPDLNVSTYRGVGSGTGKKLLFTGDLTIAISEAPGTDAEFAANRTLFQIPITGLMLVLCYNLGESNLDGSIPEMNITREHLYRICSGQLSQWSQMAQINPSMPSVVESKNITRVVRADSSGATSIVTSACAAYAKLVKESFPSGTAITWPNNAANFLTATGSSGVALKTVWRIGAVTYTEEITARNLFLKSFRIVQPSGRIVNGSEATVKAAFSGANITDRTEVKFNYSDEAMWPLTGVAYALIVQSDDCCHMYWTQKSLRLLMSNVYSNFGLMDLPSGLQDQILSKLNALTCVNNGAKVLVSSLEYLFEPSPAVGSSGGVPLVVVVASCCALALVVAAAVVMGGLYAKRLRRVHRQLELENRAAPQGYVVCCFTDVQSSTTLWCDRRSVMKTSIMAMFAAMRRILKVNNGYEVKTEGDAFICVFHGAKDAVAFATGVQVALLQEDWDEELLTHSEAATVHNGDDLVLRGLRVRMALAGGHLEHSEDPTTHRLDYFGPDMSRAARLCVLAHGSQILLSESLFDELRMTVDIDKFYLSSPTEQVLLRGFAETETPVEISSILLGKRIGAFPPLRVALANEREDLTRTDSKRRTRKTRGRKHGPMHVGPDVGVMPSISVTLSHRSGLSFGSEDFGGSSVELPSSNMQGNSVTSLSSAQLRDG